MGSFRNLATEDLPDYRECKPSPILSEDRVSSLLHAREGIAAERLKRLRQLKDVSVLDACLSDIDKIYAEHQAGLAKVAGVLLHG